MVVAIGGGWVLLRSTGALAGLFAALAPRLFLYGAGVLTSVVTAPGLPARGRGVPSFLCSGSTPRRAAEGSHERDDS